MVPVRTFVFGETGLQPADGALQNHFLLVGDFNGLLRDSLRARLSLPTCSTEMPVAS
jgi:hypothetical protein